MKIPTLIIRKTVRKYLKSLKNDGEFIRYFNNDECSYLTAKQAKILAKDGLKDFLVKMNLNFHTYADIDFLIKDITESIFFQLSRMSFETKTKAILDYSNYKYQEQTAEEKAQEYERLYITVTESEPYDNE